ncbi:MAG: hypothetical protein WDO16_10295 [Bacteroidota bacterium]
MSVIQNIQEKYAKLMAIIIAIALIIFVVMLLLKMAETFSAAAILHLWAR